MLTAVCVLAEASDRAAPDGASLGASRGFSKNPWQNQWHGLRRMVYPIDLPREAHGLPYNRCKDNRLNSETEIYDTTMSMLNGCPL